MPDCHIGAIVPCCCQQCNQPTSLINMGIHSCAFTFDSEWIVWRKKMSKKDKTENQ